MPKAVPFPLRLVAAALAVAAVGPALADIQSRTLDNGLQVYVREDHRAPVVTSMVWYRVGGVDEHRGITGVSHLLEHMMFKGTDKLAPGELSEIIARNGGKDNAFTGQDYTAYFQQIAADRLEVAFRLEADRMANLALDPAELEKEAQVVMEERRLRVTDQPRARAREVQDAVAFDAHGYGHPIIGWQKDLEGLALADLQAWYDRYYRPGNAVVVVAGDVDPEEVFGLAEEHFGAVSGTDQGPAQAVPSPDPAEGSRQVDLRARARVPFLTAGYRAPNLAAADKDWEPYALRLAAGLLAEGRSARLPAGLVREKEVAAQASARYRPLKRGATQFYVEATPSPEASLEKLEQALFAEVRRLGREAPGEAELDRVKRQIAADEVFSRDSVFYKAMEVGQAVTAGYGTDYLDGYLERIRAVTPEQVRRAAAKYLVPERRTLVRLHPESEKEAAR
jgi:zinc protease